MGERGEKNKLGKCLSLESINDRKPESDALCCGRAFHLKNMQSVLVFLIDFRADGRSYSHCCSG